MTRKKSNSCLWQRNNYVLIRVDHVVPGFGGEISVVETESKVFATAVGADVCGCLSAALLRYL